MADTCAAPESRGHRGANRRDPVPAEVEEAAGDSGVVLLLFLELAVPLQAALATLVQVRSHVDARAVLQEGLSRLLQLPHLAHVLQHRLANCREEKERGPSQEMCINRFNNMTRHIPCELSLSVLLGDAPRKGCMK